MSIHEKGRERVIMSVIFGHGEADVVKGAIFQLFPSAVDLLDASEDSAVQM